MKKSIKSIVVVLAIGASLVTGYTVGNHNGYKDGVQSQQNKIETLKKGYKVQSGLRYSNMKQAQELARLVVKLAPENADFYITVKNTNISVKDLANYDYERLVKDDRQCNTDFMDSLK